MKNFLNTFHQVPPPLHVIILEVCGGEDGGSFDRLIVIDFVVTLMSFFQTTLDNIKFTSVYRQMLREF